MSAPLRDRPLTNTELRALAEERKAAGETFAQALHRWFDRHVPPVLLRPAGAEARDVDREHWIAWAVQNLISDPELAPHLENVTVGLPPDAVARAVEEGTAQARIQERRWAYNYLKFQADGDVRRRPQHAIDKDVVGNMVVRYAGEILRGLHANPVKINNPELWK